MVQHRQFHIVQQYSHSETVNVTFVKWPSNDDSAETGIDVANMC